MYRNKVLLYDAITAISLIEASMQSSSIVVDSPNTLHTAFPSDPMEEYANQGNLNQVIATVFFLEITIVILTNFLAAELILRRLELDHLWENEKVYLENLKLSSSRPKSSGSSRPFNSTQGRPQQNRRIVKTVDNQVLSKEVKNILIPESSEESSEDSSQVSSQIHIPLSANASSNPSSSPDSPFIQLKSSSEEDSDSQEEQLFEQQQQESKKRSRRSDSSEPELDLTGKVSEEDLFGSCNVIDEPLFHSSAIQSRDTSQTTYSLQSSRNSSSSETNTRKKNSETNSPPSSLTPHTKRKKSIQSKLSKFKRAKTDDDE